MLRQVVGNEPYLGFRGTAKDYARLALARLGETEQLQQFWCGAIGDNGGRAIIHPIQWIRGWFAIRAMEQFLHGVGERTRQEAEHRAPPNDVIHESMQEAPLTMLPSLIPGAPYGEPKTLADWTELPEKWRA